MTELMADEHLAATQMFIEANPSTVTLYRAVRVPDGRGGSTKLSATPVAQFTGRLVGHSPGLTEGARTSQDGQQVSPQYSLICPVGTDVLPGDTFSLFGTNFAIVEVSLSPPWRVAAEVMTL